MSGRLYITVQLLIVCHPSLTEIAALSPFQKACDMGNFSSSSGDFVAIFTGLGNVFETKIHVLAVKSQKSCGNCLIQMYVTFGAPSQTIGQIMS